MMFVWSNLVGILIVFFSTGVATLVMLGGLFSILV